MKLSDLLVQESMSSSYEYTVINDDEDSFAAEFVTSNGKTISTYLEQHNTDTHGESTWELGFSSMMSRGDGTSRFNFDATGDGDGFRVFATVMKITKDFISRRKDVNQIEFTAEKSEDSRVSLYTRMVKRFTPPGWTAAVDNDQAVRDTYFILKKAK